MRIKNIHKEHLNYPTCFDVYGEEYYIYYTKLNEAEGISIELYYGRNIEIDRSPPQLIFRRDLKELIENNPMIKSNKFGEFLPSWRIHPIRRKFKKNPYKNYEAWRDSKDVNKPKEISFLNTKTNHEIITDYFGIKWILYSASIAKNGMIFPMGIAIDRYKMKNSARAKMFILTTEIAEYVKVNCERPKRMREQTSIGYDIFNNFRKDLGFDKTVDYNLDIWLAAHITEIYMNTTKKFVADYVKDYIKDTVITFNTIKGFNKGLNVLVKHSKSKDKKEQKILREIQLLEKIAPPEVNIRLQALLTPWTARIRTKAYKVLMIARDNKYDMPNELRKVLKHPYPKQR